MNGCKILRKVDYPETIDVYDFCSEPIQTLLKINREIEDKRLEEQLNARRAKMEGSNTIIAEEEKGAVLMDEDIDEEQAALALSLGSVEQTAPPPNVFKQNGLPADFTGLYELTAIVTHKGTIIIIIIIIIVIIIILFNKVVLLIQDII